MCVYRKFESNKINGELCQGVFPVLQSIVGRDVARDSFPTTVLYVRSWIWVVSQPEFTFSKLTTETPEKV